MEGAVEQWLSMIQPRHLGGYRSRCILLAALFCTRTVPLHAPEPVGELVTALHQRLETLNSALPDTYDVLANKIVQYCTTTLTPAILGPQAPIAAGKVTPKIYLLSDQPLPLLIEIDSLLTSYYDVCAKLTLSELPGRAHTPMIVWQSLLKALHVGWASDEPGRGSNEPGSTHGIFHLLRALRMQRPSRKAIQERKLSALYATLITLATTPSAALEEKPHVYLKRIHTIITERLTWPERWYHLTYSQQPATWYHDPASPPSKNDPRIEPTGMEIIEQEFKLWNENNMQQFAETSDWISPAYGQILTSFVYGIEQAVKSFQVTPSGVASQINELWKQWFASAQQVAPYTDSLMLKSHILVSHLYAQQPKHHDLDAYILFSSYLSENEPTPTRFQALVTELATTFSSRPQTVSHPLVHKLYDMSHLLLGRLHGFPTKKGYPLPSKDSVKALFDQAFPDNTTVQQLFLSCTLYKRYRHTLNANEQQLCLGSLTHLLLPFTLPQNLRGAQVKALGIPALITDKGKQASLTSEPSQLQKTALYSLLKQFEDSSQAMNTVVTLDKKFIQKYL